MASKCTIVFDNNPLGVFYAGQVVSGNAELITSRPKTIRTIQIIVSGFAEVRWTENITKQDTHGKPQKAIETFSATELYFSYENYVYGQSGGSQLELPAGRYIFPFKATIPPNAPTSFNGAWGQIKHEVTLVVDRVMRYNNEFKKPFSVLSPYDLNLNPANGKSLHKIEEKTFCWGLCCGTKGPMIMTVSVPFASYAPGQKIRFSLVLDNQSDVHCSDVKVRLVKQVVYTSRSPDTKTKITELKIADNHCGEVVKLNKAVFNEFLQIPSTTPTSLESCSIIKISYVLKFIAKVSRLYGDLVIDFPLTIGTLPLYASANDSEAIMTQPGVAPTYKPLPPPMFEEDICKEQFESNTYKPRYPVFLAEAYNTVGRNTMTNIYPRAAPTLSPPGANMGTAQLPNLGFHSSPPPANQMPAPSAPTNIGWKH